MTRPVPLLPISQGSGRTNSVRSAADAPPPASRARKGPGRRGGTSHGLRLPLLRLGLPLLGLPIIVAACGAATTVPPAAAPGPVGQAVSPAPPAPDAAAVAAAPEPRWTFPTQNRPDVSGTHGAVVSDHPLASAAGYDVLRRGGTAVDAAIATAAVLAVVRPHMNGLGGDAFALFYEAATGQVTALNASGRAGAKATPAFFAERGMRRIPGSGAASVTVPGALSGWVAALERYGTMPLAELLEPAIRYARDGWPVTATLQRDIASSVRGLNEGGRAIFAPGGALPPIGALLRNEPLARTLQAIADEGPGVFYGGRVGETLARFVEAEGGHLTPADFAAHRPEWVEPLSLQIGGRRLHTMPPNSQGIALLQQLAMASRLPLDGMAHNSADYLHALIELKKLAFADRDRWVADPVFAEVPVARLLDEQYLARRARQVGPTAAAEVSPGLGDPLASEPASGDGDTVYLMVVDAQGNAVSWIQSLFSSFGSRLVEPESGIVLQNRGSGFTLEEGHPNLIAPGKRPFHTLMPLLVTDADGRLRMTIGTPGGHGQTQFLTQVYLNVFLFGMTPQQAVEAPRFISNDGLDVQLESRVPLSDVEALRARGHEIRDVDGWSATLGGVQIILRDPVTGVLRAGADPRREAYAIAY